ncbi:MAG: pantoate--beta-alanine ligase [Phycisphaeraceae bacterium]
MWISTTVDDARQHCEALSGTGTVAFVPTMGALHAGHMQLVEEAHKLADAVVVSIFVNPTQFGPSEDFEKYPRTLESDLRKCEAAGVAGVFNPDADEMYPPTALDTAIDVPDLTGILEGAKRPGHFAGVCRVVAKLLNIVRPTYAMFGQKDYQQLKVIEAMADDLMMNVAIAAVATVREADGLALSSRNRYLDQDERRHAGGLHKALMQAKSLVEEAGETDPHTVEQAMTQVLEAHHMEVDYAVIRHPQTLGELDCVEPELTGGVVALIAARLGGVRLIDNMVLGE